MKWKSCSGDFRQETTDNLELVEQSLMALEGGDAGAIDAAFRGLHSIKGGSSFLDLIKVNRLSHSLENVLDLARQHQLVLTPDVLDVVMSGTDILRGLCESSDMGESEDISDPLDKLRVILENGTAESVNGSTVSVASAPRCQ